MEDGHYRRVVVLLWADMFAGYVIWILQEYLTNVWKLDFTHAAAIQNVFSGLTNALPLGFVLAVDSFLSHKWMLIFSSIAYSVGLGLLSMSTPPVLSKSAGNCSKYEPECVGRTQKAFFYTSLALIAVGVSGHIVSLAAFASEQIRRVKSAQTNNANANETETENDPEETHELQPVDAIISLLKERRITSSRVLLVILIPVIGIFALPYANPWSIRFGVPAICTLVATILFFSGFCCGVYVNEDNPPDSLPTNVLRITFRMLPFWISFIISGMVTSIGNTYFVEQAKNLNYKVGKLKITDSILFLVYQHFEIALFKIFSRTVNNKYAPAIGIAFAVLCCITASEVENRRIGVITDHGLLDKPDEKIPMSVFWLIPQYVLLDVHDWIMVNSIAGFFRHEVSASMTKYIIYMTQTITGMGMAGSILSVFIVGKVSERGGHTNWFQETLNNSRLDNYYWVLAVLSAANFVWYVIFATRCRS